MALLSIEPLIVASTIGLKRMPLFTAMPRSVARHPCHFLLGMGWSADDDRVSDGFARVCRQHLGAHPRHRIVALCNEAGAVARLQARGVEAILIHQNAFVDDRIFKPLSGRSVRYDALYNARFVAWKRHELAREVDRLALVGYASGDDPATTAAYLEGLRAVMPGATYVNGWRDGRPIPLRPEQVNEALNEAQVGLCLSGEEGAMYASGEYLLSGLPIVSTPSVGGREYFFDAGFCLLVEPDPRQVRDAVQAMIARKIQRDHVRAKTLARVEAVRRTFFDLVQGIYEAHGSTRRFTDDWPTVRLHRFVEWVHIGPFWDDVASRRRRARRWRSPHGEGLGRHQAPGR